MSSSPPSDRPSTSSGFKRSCARILEAFVAVAIAVVAGCGGGGGSTPPATYTLGGSIRLAVTSALTGGLPAGLILADGTEALRVTAGVTQFEFPTALTTGKGYSVTVTQNPPGLICSVSDGAGTIGTADVQGVAVNCGDASYTVGGTIVGLTSSGLVLSDAAGHLLTSTAGASQFVFLNTVAFGGAYAVTIENQPVHQSCVVSNASGTMGSAAVTNVSVACPLTITPQSASMAAGASLQLTLTAQASSPGAVTWQVNGIPGGNATVGTISSTGLYLAPAAALLPRISATSAANPAASASATLAVLAPHQIAVRETGSGLAEFYDRASGEAWIARGNNFIRLASETDPNGNTFIYHSTFNVGLYDKADAESSLTAMQANGYNAVRVFVQGCCVGGIGDPAGGLSNAYMANFADFLVRARKHSIYVIVTQDGVPAIGGYDGSCPATAPTLPQFEGVNAANLCNGAITAAQRFHHDFVQSLIALGAPVGAILGYELRNEYYYSSDVGPFTSSSGVVTAANGSSYDMADATARQAMMDDGLIYLTNELRSAIVAVDPTALVTVGFFWPQSPNPTRLGDARVISVYPAMSSSSADFIDIHGYVIANDLTIEQLVENYGFVGHQQHQPVIMAEFGAFKNATPTIADAVTALKNWQTGGCAHGLKGWLLWTWDNEQASADLWNATAGDGSVNTALAPLNRPDACAP